MAATVMLVAACDALGVRWNSSPSVAPGLYFERARPLQRGDLVAFCLPETVGRWARGRGYVGRGRCPGATARVGKWIVGVEGDRVAVTEDGIAVNGRRLEAGPRVEGDSKGRPVPRVPEGELVLGQGQVWLHSGRRERSFDSRVFGPLAATQLEGALEAFWTFGEE